jgi:hypothetical protein
VDRHVRVAVGTRKGLAEGHGHVDQAAGQGVVGATESWISQPPELCSQATTVWVGPTATSGWFWLIELNWVSERGRVRPASSAAGSETLR